jgi:hypothetical protein
MYTGVIQKILSLSKKKLKTTYRLHTYRQAQQATGNGQGS